MVDPELIQTASPAIRSVAPGFFASLGIWLRSGHERKVLESEQAFAREMLQTAPDNFRFRGTAIELETFVDASERETDRLLTNTGNALLKTDSVVDWSKVDLERLNPEFRRRWAEEVSNVSDETLQHLWARLLKGELESPGSVSNDTMSIARDMTKERAEEFQTLCSAALCDLDGAPFMVVGCGKPGSNSLQPYGLSYDVLMRLAHHRLIINDMESHSEIYMGPEPSVYPVRHHEFAWGLAPSNASRRAEPGHPISGILFTPAGQELFSVVEKVPNPAYTKAMLEDLEKQGWRVSPINIVS